jgi:hypothetical protein
VAGAEQRPVSLPRRALLVALQTAVPYWLERERCAAARCDATRQRTRADNTRGVAHAGAER